MKTSVIDLRGHRLCKGGVGGDSGRSLEWSIVGDCGFGNCKTGAMLEKRWWRVGGIAGGHGGQCVKGAQVRMDHDMPV